MFDEVVAYPTWLALSKSITARKRKVQYLNNPILDFLIEIPPVFYIVFRANCYKRPHAPSAIGTVAVTLAQFSFI
jgi:hypothetical protein